MLRLSDEHRAAIAAHGERGYPEEVCGFLIGTAAPERVVTSLREIENTWDDAGASEFAQVGGSDFASASRRRRFKIPPGEYYRVDQAARTEGTAILGFYHSHPDHPARPSTYDLALAREVFPGYSYVIVSVQNGNAADMTSWVLRDDGSAFDAEEMRSCPSS